VAGGGDPRGAMNVDADVALVREQRLARVDAHAHADRPAQGCLSFPGGLERVLRTCKSDEEGIALRVDLDATVSRERLAERAAVLRQHLGVAVAELTQQARRSLDVREEKSDRPGR
jgi:hypothetical protein